MSKFYCLIFFLCINFKFFSQKSSSLKLWPTIIASDSIQNLAQKIAFYENLRLQVLNFHEPKDSIYAKLLHILGRNLWSYNKLDEAENYISESIKINESKKICSNEKHLSLSFMNRAGIEYYRKEYNKSILDFDKGINLMIKNNFRLDFVSSSYRAKANIYWLVGDFNKSIQSAEKAILFSNNDFKLNLDAKIEKIQALISLKEIQKAQNLLNVELNLVKQNLPNSLELANLYTLYGQLLFIKNDYKLAKNYFEKSILIHKSIKYNFGVATAMIEIAILLSKQNKFKEALIFLENSIKYADEDQMFILRALDEIGVVNTHLTKFEFSISTFQKAFTGFFHKNFIKDNKLNPNPKLISGKVDYDIFLPLIQHKAETWLAYYHHTHKKEYLENALATFTVADKMVDYMRQEHVGYQSKLYWRDKTHRLYENAIEVCYLLNNYEKAFYFFEKSRAVLLNDKINNLAANQLLSESDQLKERNFQQQISELNASLEQETNESKKSTLNVKMLDIQESQQKFVKGLALKYPSYYAFKYDTSMYNLAQMRLYLKARNTSFVEYFKGDSANYQLVITPKSTQIIKQTPQENLFSYLINKSNIGNRIIVSQDGDFTPMDTLKNQKGQLSINNFAFSYTYSAQLLMRNAERKMEPSYFNNFIGFAPVNYAANLKVPNLLGADVALDQVGKNYFWPNNFIGADATKVKFLKKANDYRVVQLFTHADADNLNKEPTIFFADSALKVSELESFGKFNCDLMVLSACKTNVGKLAKGEGILSMAREFAGLGIPATVTTLWSVENTATYQITNYFYTFLKQGFTKDVALQKAKLEYLNTNSLEKQDPKYWSAFVLMGESEAMQLIAVQQYINWFIVVLSIVFCYFLLRTRQKTN